MREAMAVDFRERLCMVHGTEHVLHAEPHGSVSRAKGPGGAFAVPVGLRGRMPAYGGVLPAAAADASLAA